jgi:homogentisate 1,2-dioxygenase
MPSTELRYQSGFGNEFATEAVAGALPVGQNAPQQAPLGLYAEQLSGSPFTAPRAINRRTWTYRIRPSVTHKPYTEYTAGLLRSGPFDEVPTPPNQLRWDPFPIPEAATDFVGPGDYRGQRDRARRPAWRCTFTPPTSMQARYFYNADGELLIVPQQGRLALPPNSACSRSRPGNLRDSARHQVPRRSADGASRGYICESYGGRSAFPTRRDWRNGLANARDFLAPVAAFEDLDADCRIVAKFLGKLWIAGDRSLAARRGGVARNYAPYNTTLARFNLHQHGELRSSIPRFTRC